MLTHSNADIPDPDMPEISDEELVRRSKLFTPLMQVVPGTFERIKMPEGIDGMRHHSFVWAPVLEGRAHVYLDPGSARSHEFFVRCGYYGFFKPSIAEVLSGAPCDELSAGGYNAFYLGNHVEILRSGGFQRAVAHFVRADL